MSTKNKAKEVKRVMKYIEVCQACGKEFIFSEKDVVDRLIKCPKCGHEEIFIKSNYTR